MAVVGKRRLTTGISRNASGWPIIGCTDEAILRWHTLVFAAYAFVQIGGSPLLTNSKATLTELPEVLAAHQHEHLRQTVCYIAALARRGLSDAKILADLVPT